LSLAVYFSLGVGKSGDAGVAVASGDAGPPSRLRHEEGVRRDVDRARSNGVVGLERVVVRLDVGGVVKTSTREEGAGSMSSFSSALDLASLRDCEYTDDASALTPDVDLDVLSASSKKTSKTSRDRRFEMGVCT
jgi:hypothetical protein